VAQLSTLGVLLAHFMFGPLKKKLAPGDAPEIIKKLAAGAESLAPVLRKHFDINFDYSERSLAVLDDVISGCWSAPPKNLENMVAMFGSYLGETIRRQVGGVWAKDEVGYHLVNVGGVDQRVDPFSKMRKRFLNGKDDSISLYFTCIKFVAAEILKHDPRRNA
jgi:hypothetical protein